MSYIPPYSYTGLWNEDQADAGAIPIDGTTIVLDTQDRLSVGLIGNLNITDLAAAKLLGVAAITDGTFLTALSNVLTLAQPPSPLTDRQLLVWSAAPSAGWSHRRLQAGDLDPAGATAGQVVRRGASAWEAGSLALSDVSGSLGVGRLDPAGATAGQVVRRGAEAWEAGSLALSDVSGSLGVGRLDPAGATAGQVVRRGASAWEAAQLAIGDVSGDLPLSRLESGGAAAGQAPIWSGSAWAPGNPTAAAAGAATQIQFNSGGALGASANLWWDASVSAVRSTRWRGERLEILGPGVTTFAGFIQAVTNVATADYRLRILSSRDGTDPVIPRRQIEFGAACTNQVPLSTSHAESFNWLDNGGGGDYAHRNMVLGTKGTNDARLVLNPTVLPFNALRDYNIQAGSIRAHGTMSCSRLNPESSITGTVSPTVQPINATCLLGETNMHKALRFRHGGGSTGNYGGISMAVFSNYGSPHWAIWAGGPGTTPSDGLQFRYSTTAQVSEVQPPNIETFTTRFRINGAGAVLAGELACDSLSCTGAAAVGSLGCTGAAAVGSLNAAGEVLGNTVTANGLVLGGSIISLGAVTASTSLAASSLDLTGNALLAGLRSSGVSTTAINSITLERTAAGRHAGIRFLRNGADSVGAYFSRSSGQTFRALIDEGNVWRLQYTTVSNATQKDADFSNRLALDSSGNLSATGNIAAGAAGVLSGNSCNVFELTASNAAIGTATANSVAVAGALTAASATISGTLTAGTLAATRVRETNPSYYFRTVTGRLTAGGSGQPFVGDGSRFNVLSTTTAGGVGAAVSSLNAPTNGIGSEFEDFNGGIRHNGPDGSFEVRLHASFNSDDITVAGQRFQLVLESQYGDVTFAAVDSPGILFDRHSTGCHIETVVSWPTNALRFVRVRNRGGGYRSFSGQNDFNVSVFIRRLN